MKNKVYYLIRLDDACPTMNIQKWDRIETILDKHSIKPMVGVIPANNDLSLKINDFDSFFWDKVNFWQMKGWSIALHGFDHVYLTNSGGINPVHKRSEFAGLSLMEQEEKIEKGISIFKDHNLDVQYYFAPSHTFDKNTLQALKNKSKIRKISDTIARNPYKRDDMIFYPLQFGCFRNIKYSGYWTFCFHPNVFDDNSFSEFESFISLHHDKFISIDAIDDSCLKRKSLIDTFLSFIYFAYRRLKFSFNFF